MKKYLVFSLIAFSLNVIAQQNIVTNIEYDGAYIEVASGKYISLEEVPASVGGFTGHPETLRSRIPQILFVSSKSSPTSMKVEKVGKILLKGAEFSQTTFAVGISKVQNIYRHDMSIPGNNKQDLLSPNTQGTFVYTPELYYGKEYKKHSVDSVNIIRTVDIKKRKLPNTNTTEILVTGVVEPYEEYCVWFNSAGVNKMWFFKLLPNNTIATMNHDGVFFEEKLGRYIDGKESPVYNGFRKADKNKLITESPLVNFVPENDFNLNRLRALTKIYVRGVEFQKASYHILLSEVDWGSSWNLFNEFNELIYQDKKTVYMPKLKYEANNNMPVDSLCIIKAIDTQIKKFKLPNTLEITLTEPLKQNTRYCISIYNDDKTIKPLIWFFKIEE